MKYDRKQKVFAWIKKYIFHIASPSAVWYGYKYEWDMIKAKEAEYKKAMEENKV